MRVRDSSVIRFAQMKNGKSDGRMAAPHCRSPRTTAAEAVSGKSSSAQAAADKIKSSSPSRRSRRFCIHITSSKAYAPPERFIRRGIG